MCAATFARACSAPAMSAANVAVRSRARMNTYSYPASNMRLPNARRSASVIAVLPLNDRLLKPRVEAAVFTPDTVIWNSS